MEQKNLTNSKYGIIIVFFSYFFIGLANFAIFKLIINYQEFLQSFFSVLLLDAIFLVSIFLLDETFLYKFKLPSLRYFLYYILSGVIGLTIFEFILIKNYDVNLPGIILLFLVRAGFPTFAFLISDTNIDKFFRQNFVYASLILYTIFIFIGFFCYFVFNTLESLRIIMVFFILALNIFLLKKIHDLQ
jgi:hypothetical protein